MEAKQYVGGRFLLIDCVDDLVELYESHDFIIQSLMPHMGIVPVFSIELSSISAVCYNTCMINTDLINDMVLFHGSTQAIMFPDLEFSNARCDFGPGFYCTQNKEQAKEWGRIKAYKSRRYTQFAVSEYSFKEAEGLSYKKFSKPTPEWFLEVIDGRKGFQLKADIIIGPVADAGIMDLIDETECKIDNLPLFSKFEDFLKARREILEEASQKAVLGKYRNYDQVVFLSPRALESLEFKGARLYTKDGIFLSYMDSTGLTVKKNPKQKEKQKNIKKTKGRGGR